MSWKISGDKTNDGVAEQTQLPVPHGAGQQSPLSSASSEVYGHHGQS